MSEFLGKHWFALLLFLTAAVIVVGPVRKKLPNALTWLAVTFLLLFALGGLLLGAWEFDTYIAFVYPRWWCIYFATGGLLILALALLIFRRWSFYSAAFFASLLALGLGGVLETEISSSLAESWRYARGLHFVKPWWLLLLVFIPFVILVAMRSLSGIGSVRKWFAIGARCGIVAALACALAEPRFGRRTDEVAVLFVVDRSQSIPQEVDFTVDPEKREDLRWRRIRAFVENAVNHKGPAHRYDLAGVVLFGKRPKLALPPSPAIGWMLDDRMAGPIDGQYTDIAAALKLAMASFPEGAGRRIVLISDGNENLGSADNQAAIARTNGVQIDTVALAPGYRNENEILVQSVEAPKHAATGTRMPVYVLVRNSNPSRLVEGRLELYRAGPDENGQDRDELLPIDDSDPFVLDNGQRPDGKITAPIVRLKPGLKSFRFSDRASGPKDSSYSYRATFTPIRSMNDTGSDVVIGLPGDRVTNNRAGTVVVTRSQRKVLFVDGTTGGRTPHEHLIRTLQRSKIDVVLRPVDLLPQNADDFTKFASDHDCIILANVPAEALSFGRQEAIRSCVHDQGCGLVMIGGPDAFGPGGYQGTPVEAALPVDCEIKALKAAGKGGLILIMHATEMDDGNKWQKEIAKLAIQRLNPVDMVGVMQYGFGGGQGVSWVIPFSEIGDNKNKMLSQIDGMTPGDMPDFDPFLTVAVDTLSDEKHGLSVRHTILISDGDPSYGPTGLAAVRKMAENNITCTTIGVATHSQAEGGKLRSIANGTRDGKGQPGSYYEPNDPSKLPEIYIKESRRISQSFIYDKPFEPMLRLRGGPTEGLPNSLPRLHGFVRTTKKESNLVDMRIEGPKMFDQEFPILATWQYGLGKAAAFTSDARTQPNTAVAGWDREWVEWQEYQKFWEQTVVWAMRAAEKGRLTLTAEYKEGRVKVMVEARDEKDRPIGGLDLKGGISLPRPAAPGEKLPAMTFKKRGAGRYEAEFTAEEAGSYFINIQGYQAGKLFDYARTGLTVPYSQEFADLETNTPLLRRLAEATGGTFHTEDPADLDALVRSGDLFRAAPKTSRAVRPFWFWLVFIAGILLLFDVGIRRVSLEWLEVRTGAAMFWKGMREKHEQIGDGIELDRLAKRKLEVGAALERERAARKFEPDSTNPAAPIGADELVGDRSSIPLPGAAPPIREKTPEEATDMLSRLQRRKKGIDHDKPRGSG